MGIVTKLDQGKVELENPVFQASMLKKIKMKRRHLEGAGGKVYPYILEGEGCRR